MRLKTRVYGTLNKAADANDTVSQVMYQLQSALTQKASASSATVASRIGDSPAKVVETDRNATLSWQS